MDKKKYTLLMANSYPGTMLGCETKDCTIKYAPSSPGDIYILNVPNVGVVHVNPMSSVFVGLVEQS